MNLEVNLRIFLLGKIYTQGASQKVQFFPSESRARKTYSKAEWWHS